MFSEILGLLFHLYLVKTKTDKSKKEEQSRRDHNTQYQTILRGHRIQNTLVLAEEQTRRSMEQKRVQDKSTSLWSIHIQQRGREHKME